MFFVLFKTKNIKQRTENILLFFLLSLQGYPHFFVLVLNQKQLLQLDMRKLQKKSELQADR